MRTLVIGDVVGRPGRKAVQQLLPGLRKEYSLDFVVCNGENAAHGAGITPETAQELLSAGVDVITTGNHVWAQKEIIPYLNGPLPILRPLNYPPGAPGRGLICTDKAIVINLMGRTFIGNYDCPFRGIDQVLPQLMEKHLPIIVDFHAEATSEKMAMGRYLDGRVSAVFGTHTHVATADLTILPLGTAYMTDIGMVGPIDSVIGNDVESVINNFLVRMPYRITVAKGRTGLSAVFA
ncbi:MAG: TIGR00282 family metallophosphoesterase, partial [Dehalococcoidia bacterium]|nr:TIGR00282 family metallophosphoesterase [Dehalococcoidia bacterium]